MNKKITIKLLLIIFLFSFILQSVVIANFQEIGKEKSNKENLNSNQEQLINIQANQIHDECIIQSTDSFVRLAKTLVDEQDKLPVTPNQEMTVEQIKLMNISTWYPATKQGIDKVSCYIDLKGIYHISHIAFLDANGNPTITFSQGSPFHWKEIISYEMKDYLKWTCIPVQDVETRYLQITSNSKDSGITEIAIYGYLVEEVEDKENSIEKPDFGITIDKAVGANGFIDDRMSEISAVGHIREYHNYRWVITKQGENKFNPGAAWPWDFDAYYQMLHENDIDVIPCIQGTSPFLLDPDDVKNGRYTNNEKPCRYDLDPSQPESYADHASSLFQYAARYGSTKVAEDKLLLASNQEKKTGLGYIQYYENNNEPDKNWETIKSYASPYELAAMCSADYDGHEGKMGDTYGIKNADPNSKLVLGGLAGGKTEYLDLMKLWFENNREDKKIAFDVINFHQYSGNQAPESSGFKEKCKEITTWRDENAPDKEVWLTEFGWDTNSQSPLAAPSEKVQGDWLIRGYLNAFSAGIDRATMFMLRDAGASSSTGKYGTSGLTTQKGEWNKKTSWYYVSTLKQTLKDYTLKEVEETPSLYRYVFEKKGTDELCYVLWCPTSDGSKVENYHLSIAQRTKANLITLENGYEAGKQSELEVKDNQVQVNVSESPIFIQVKDRQEISLTSDSYQIENEIISQIPINTSVEELKAKIKTTATNIQVLDLNEKEVTNVVATGMKLVLDREKEYQLSVIGDLNQDGKISSTDLLMLKRHLVAGEKKEWVLTGGKWYAADIKCDHQITPTDLLKLKRLVLENI